VNRKPGAVRGGRIGSFRHSPRLFLAVFALWALPPTAATSLTPSAGTSLQASSEGRISIAPSGTSSRIGLSRDLAERLRRLMVEGSQHGALWLLLVAAAYGILHALGPGHQKTLISGYMLAEGGGFRQVLRAAFIASLSHAVSVVLLLGILILLNHGFSPASDAQARSIMSRVSGAILLSLTARLLIHRVRDAWQRTRSRPQQHHHHSCQPCSCRGSSAPLLFGSLVPCPGPAFFLLYGFSVGTPLAGILAVLAMSFGMWCTLVAVGSLASVIRSWGLRQTEEGSHRGALLSGLFELSGTLLMLVFAVLLLAGLPI